MDIDALCRETALHLFGDLRSEAAIQAGIRQVRPTVEFVAARVRAEAKAELDRQRKRLLELGNQHYLNWRAAERALARLHAEVGEREAAIRAEAVAERRRALNEAADEVRRERQTVSDHRAVGFDPAGRLAILENLLRARARAAGSVPVATPPAAQRTRQSEVRGTAHGTGVYAELEAARAPDPARRSPRRVRTGEPETPVAIGIDDTSQGQCAAAANLRGGHIRCDLAVDHSGWAHSNREHELIWDGPPGELTPS